MVDIRELARLGHKVYTPKFDGLPMGRKAVYIHGHYSKIVVTDDFYEKKVTVEGRTYPIRRLLKEMGFKWNPKKRRWEGHADPMMLEKELDRCGCIEIYESATGDLDLGAHYTSVWLCPFRR